MQHPSADAALARIRSGSAVPGVLREDQGSRHVILVADRFAHFADGEQVLTVLEIMALAASSRAPFDGDWVLHVGQGIDRADLDAVKVATLASTSFHARFADSESVLRQPVPLAIVHKYRPENVLLADLAMESKTHCSAELRIHKDNELILDHHFAKHVPGMVIVEAMRQICTAQFEASYRPDLSPGDYVGLWHRMDVRFESFLFALRARVVSEITDVDLAGKTRVRIRTRTSLQQNGDMVASAGIEYSMVQQERVGVLERRKATRAARVQLAGSPEQ